MRLDEVFDEETLSVTVDEVPVLLLAVKQKPGGSIAYLPAARSILRHERVLSHWAAIDELRTSNTAAIFLALLYTDLLVVLSHGRTYNSLVDKA